MATIYAAAMPGEEIKAALQTASAGLLFLWATHRVDRQAQARLCGHGFTEVSTPAKIEGDAAKGQGLYAACAACHGASGEGNEALAAPGLAGRNDWYLFRQIKLFQSGYRGQHPDDTAGQLMRPSALALQSDDDINDVLAYINTLD